MLPTMYIQFPDLTELFAGSLDPGAINLQSFKTEFIFAVSAPNANDRTVEGLREVGLKHLSSMKNWWPSHRDEEERTLKFWWKKTSLKTPYIGAIRQKWEYSSPNLAGEEAEHFKHTAFTGCGFKIGELPLRAARFHQFFTVMRLPLKLVGFQKRWLERYHFRHVDTGTFAQYWVNGWKPEEYTVDLEMEYWRMYADKKKAIAKARSRNMDR
jgi:hypothetical protein